MSQSPARRFRRHHKHEWTQKTDGNGQWHVVCRTCGAFGDKETDSNES